MASDVLALSIRQALWRNILGVGDRASVLRADAKIEIARMNRQELLEAAILDSLSVYWNAYVAETQLRENSAARQKYEELVKAVRRKAGFNLSSPGELSRLEAEFEAADSRVKISSKDFLAALDKLRTNLQIGKDEAITFKATATETKDIPDFPKLKSVDIDRLRPMVIAKLTMENGERGDDAVLKRTNNLNVFAVNLAQHFPHWLPNFNDRDAARILFSRNRYQ